MSQPSFEATAADCNRAECALPVALSGVPEGPGADLAAERGELHGTDTILLVEDETFVRQVTAEVLKAAGYKVLVTKNAVEAACVYEFGYVDLLLTDVILPGESGRMLARKLRRHDPSLRILLITGYGEQMAISAMGEDMRCLPKPFSARLLLQTVRQVLDGRLTDDEIYPGNATLSRFAEKVIPVPATARSG